jgi:ankyrin repeat protein
MADAFVDTLAGLEVGDFSRLEPQLTGDPSPIIVWLEAGQLDDHPRALAEALTCACFLGRLEVARALLAHGVPPSGGDATGLDALHWAANRGQLAIVRLLLDAHAPLETRSSYGGTVLGTTIWSAIHEPRPDHLAILEALLVAGARFAEAGYPTGHVALDDILRRYAP